MAIKAEGGCRLVLPGVRTCAPFEEPILREWTGALAVHPFGWGFGGRSLSDKKCPSQELNEALDF